MEVNPEFSLQVWEDQDLPENVFGEACMCQVSCNVADGGWPGVFVLASQEGVDLVVVGFVHTLGDEP